MTASGLTAHNLAFASPADPEPWRCMAQHELLLAMMSTTLLTMVAIPVIVVSMTAMMTMMSIMPVVPGVAIVPRMAIIISGVAIVPRMAIIVSGVAIVPGVAVVPDLPHRRIVAR